MNFGNILKKAMIDKGITGASALSEQVGVSYYIVLRLLKNDGTCRLNDLVTVSDFLDADVFNKGE
tara:strand:+ start:53 stop:247 length:195 start_codon:yes stop_codon:yes gene_type:complete